MQLNMELKMQQVLMSPCHYQDWLEVPAGSVLGEEQTRK